LQFCYNIILDTYLWSIANISQRSELECRRLSSANCFRSVFA